jgi:hypothetical protein
VLAAGAVHLVDVTVPGARQGDRAEASLASSRRFIELDAFTWTNNTVRVLARNGGLGGRRAPLDAVGGTAGGGRAAQHPLERAEKKTINNAAGTLLRAAGGAGGECR